MCGILGSVFDVHYSSNALQGLVIGCLGADYHLKLFVHFLPPLPSAQSFICDGFNVTIANLYNHRFSSPHEVRTFCGHVLGYLSVYRIMLAVAGFFFLMAVLMICVRSTRDPRSYVQNGFWFFKWLFVIVVAIGLFFVPPVQNLVFSQGGWGWEEGQGQPQVLSAWHARPSPPGAVDGKVG